MGLLRKAVWIMLFSLVLAACSNSESTQVPIDEEPPPVQEEPEEEMSSGPEGPRSPLTGMPVDEMPEQRVLGVMLDNHNQARPQSGLEAADIVYEVLAEGDITRYLALFHSEIPDVIGPVRSLRPYYIDLARGFDAVVAHAGGSPAAKAEIDQTGYPSLDGTRSGGFVFYRTDHRRAPHNLYTGLEKIKEGIDRFGYDQDYRVPQLSFMNEGKTVEGETALWVEVDYSSGYRVSYEYDQQKERYTRLVRGNIHTDEQSGEPLMYSNILVVETAHQVIDDALRRKIDVTGEGQGYLFQQGKVRQVTWRFSDGVIRPFINGEEVALTPGKTWVNVIPDQPGLMEKVSYSKERP